ncbi:hypothetical protein [Niabella ginsengisoli]|uniref:Uncharacterized protein n=1 Tax=Niabella ginsengisoli TaxID=522298 RepID=A0ABS9SQM5_9BACT|nr:hypothetical protein [Niabella ginsengisoli]MCH5600676.1 hypothetical protein [Niabella ginsengisoli]
MRTLLFTLALISSSLVYSQHVKITLVDSLGRELPIDTSRWMPKYHQNILASMRLVYKKSDLFKEVPGVECFKNNPKLNSILSCAGNQLHSADEEFMAFIPVYKTHTVVDSISLKRTFPGMQIGNLNNQHCGQIRAKILLALDKDASIKGENANFNWKVYVNYYSQDDAKFKFNADTAISFPIHLKETEYYKGKYKYLKALFLQKKTGVLFTSIVSTQRKEKRFTQILERD